MKTTWKQYENNYEKYEIYGKYGKENTSNIYKYENYTKKKKNVWKPYKTWTRAMKWWNTGNHWTHGLYRPRGVCIYAYIICPFVYMYTRICICRCICICLISLIYIHVYVPVRVYVRKRLCRKSHTMRQVCGPPPFCSLSHSLRSTVLPLIGSVVQLFNVGNCFKSC